MKSQRNGFASTNMKAITRLFMKLTFGGKDAVFSSRSKGKRRIVIHHIKYDQDQMINYLNVAFLCWDCHEKKHYKKPTYEYKITVPTQYEYKGIRGHQDVDGHFPYALKPNPIPPNLTPIPPNLTPTQPNLDQTVDERPWPWICGCGITWFLLIFIFLIWLLYALR